MTNSFYIVIMILPDMFRELRIQINSNIEEGKHILEV